MGAVQCRGCCGEVQDGSFDEVLARPAYHGEDFGASTGVEKPAAVSNDEATVVGATEVDFFRTIVDL